METAPTSVEVFLRPTLGQSDEPSDLRGSLSPTTRHRCTMVADSSHLVSAFPRTIVFWARMRVCENNQREREKYADARIRERETSDAYWLNS